MGLLNVITGGITSLVDGWFETKREKQKQESKISQMKITGSDDYDIEALRQKKHSFSDEYLLIIHTFPWWGYIIPSEGLTERLNLLWGKMGEMPDYWWWCYIGMIISTFGLRFMHKKITRK